MKRFLVFVGLSFTMLSCSTPETRMPAGEVVKTNTTFAKDVKAAPRTYEHVDFDFVEQAEGRRFEYVRPAKADGEPNCVAAALRAGRYLPAFAVSGTDDVAENILPVCFVKRDADTAKPGDLGVLRFTLGTFTTLAHMFLVIEDGAVFEKPTPQNKDLFRKSRFSEARKAAEDKNISLEIWTYQPGPKCPTVLINDDFAKLPENHLLKRVSREIDRRIFSDDWTTPSSAFSKQELTSFTRTYDRQLRSWFLTLPGGFKPERDRAELMRREFQLNLVKTALRIPSTK